MHEDGGAVLIADIAELPVDDGGVDVVPEDVEQLLIRHLCRVKDHLHGFGVSGLAAGDLFVRRVVDVPARVARDGRNHPRHFLECLFHTPEAAAGERGLGVPGVLRRGEGGGRYQQRGSQNKGMRQDSCAFRCHNVHPFQNGLTILLKPV